MIRIEHPSKRLLRGVFAGWLAFGLLAPLGGGYSFVASAAFAGVLGLILLPTLLISSTWIEVSSDGLTVRNPWRQRIIQWDEVRRFDLGWHSFSTIGRIHLKSGETVWLHAVAAGNGLSARMEKRANDRLDEIASYRP